VTGLPEETDNDVIKTIELMDELKDFPSLIVPLFFVPMGKLKEKDWFRKEELRESQIELLKKCLRHDLYWAKRISNRYFEKKLRYIPLKYAIFMFVKIVEWEGKRKKVLW